MRRKFRRFSTKRTVGKYENKAALPLLVRKTIKLLYKRNRLRFSVRMYCNNAQMTPERVKNKKSRHSTSSRAVLFSSLHALTSSVHYYSTHARKNVIYCLNTAENCRQITNTNNAHIRCFLQSDATQMFKYFTKQYHKTSRTYIEKNIFNDEFPVRVSKLILVI